MRSCFIPGRMFSILDSSASEFILILIVFDVFIDFPFGMVMIFCCCCGIFFSVGARSCTKFSDAAVSKKLYCLRYYFHRRMFSNFDLNC